MALYEFGQHDVADVIRVQIEDERGGLAAAGLTGRGRPGPEGGNAGTSNSDSLSAGGRPWESRGLAALPPTSWFSRRALRDAQSAGHSTISKTSLSGLRLRSTRTLLLVSTIAMRRKICRWRAAFPLCVTGSHFTFQPGNIGSGIDGHQGARGRGDLGAEVVADTIEACLQAAAQAVACGRADLADPTVLQHAQNSAQDEESGHEEPG